MQLDQLQAEDFEPLLGHNFPVEVADGTLACELTQVHRLPSHAVRANPPFAVTLRGPRNQPFAQGIYALRHPQHGQLNLFMVPIGPDSTGLCYEITFN